MASLEKQLYTGQVAQAYKHMPEGATGNIVNAGILTFFLWKVTDHVVLVSWLSCVLAITIVRLVIYRRYRQSPRQDRRLWGRLFISGLTLSGLTWGLAGIFLFPAQSIVHQFLIALIIGGMVMGATATSAAIKNAFYPYCVLALAPITINFFSFGDEAHTGMGLAATLFAVLSMITSYHIHLIIRSSIILSHENRQEIIERKKAEQELKKHQSLLEEKVRSRTRELEAKIAEIQQAHGIIRANEQRLKLALEAANQGLYDLDIKTGKMEVSPEYALMLGYDPAEFTETTQKWRERLHPEDREKVASFYESHMRGEKENYQVEFRQRTKSGDWLWILSHGKIVERDARGDPARMLGTHTDITRIKKAEAALQESEERYRTLIETLPYGIGENDLDGNITFSNKAHQEILGHSEEEMLAKKIWDLLPTEPEKQQLRKYLRKLIRDQPAPVPFYGKNITKTGKIIDVRVDWNYKRNEQGALIGFISVISDITDQKKAEEELIRSQKLESVGILAGGIAHDFNNLLTVILGNLLLAKKEAATDSNIYELLGESEKAAGLAKSLTQQLLTFSKGGAPVAEPAAIPDLVQDAARFALSGSNLVLQTSMPADLWPAEVDPGQIGQVIRNITNNARQAMPQGGTITLNGENLNLAAGAVPGLEPGRYVKISIRDAGPGIPQEYIDKIFDPYFTTKQQGSGLGLAICYSIIRKHHGTITVDSKPGSGAVFNVFLPASTKAPPDRRQEKEFSGTGRILLMDDEKMVRDVALKILRRLGYQAELAADGAEAIALYAKAKEEGRPFAAVILDLTTPGGMGGEETAKKLRTIDPNVKAVVSSGYADNPVMANFKRYGFAGALPKPYSIGSLSKTLQSVLKT